MQVEARRSKFDIESYGEIFGLCHKTDFGLLKLEFSRTKKDINVRLLVMHSRSPFLLENIDRKCDPSFRSTILFDICLNPISPLFLKKNFLRQTFIHNYMRGLIYYFLAGNIFTLVLVLLNFRV